jgi:hypothetical protein
MEKATQLARRLEVVLGRVALPAGVCYASWNTNRLSVLP